MPAEDLELTFTGNVAYADYNQTEYGLTESLEWSLGGDAFYQLHPRVGLLTYYTYEWRQLWQDSRFRPRNVFGNLTPVDDPANDWWSRTQFQYHNAGIDLILALVPDRLDAEIGYLVQYGAEKTRANGAPGGSGNTGPGPIFPASLGDAVDYPRVQDLLQAVSATLGFHFTESVTLQAGYRYEDYDIDDFRDDQIPAALTDGTNLYLGDVIRDYQAHILAMSAVIRF